MTQQTEHGNRVSNIAERESAQLLAYFARRVVPVEDAADLLNETLLVMWRRADATPVDDVEARMWAYGIARRVLSTHRRAQGRRNALVDRLREELRTPSIPDPEFDEVRDAIATLRPIDQEIVRLVHWEGFKLNEVAALLGKRETTIRSRYFRARARLRQRLG